MGRRYKKVEGHYKMPIQFKKGCPELPNNNKTMAEGRLRLLSKRLKGDNILYEKYKAEMQNLLEKGYAKKVTSNDIGHDDREVWYLPHHPIFHPQTPDNLRIMLYAQPSIAVHH